MKRMESEARKTARERLREFRTSKQLSVAVFARQLGCAASNLWMIERGERRPGIRTAAAIQTHTGIEITDWLESEHAA
jgi:transcriptional regulator with XRE-family HTH domain